MYGSGKVFPASSIQHTNMENSTERRPYYTIFVEFCRTTTAHGFTWCLRLRSKVARRTLLTILFFFVISSTLQLVFNFWAFMSASTVTDNVAFLTAKKIKYPNITVCNRKYFSKRRLNGTLVGAVTFVTTLNFHQFQSLTLAMTWPTT